MSSSIANTSLLVEQLTSEQEAALNEWYDGLASSWLTATTHPHSPESQDLAEMEAAYIAEQEYYSDQFLYADRL